MATAAAANESRQYLLNWINDLLQMNVQKIEQIGTGSVLCQIFDSIYGNVALHKVKFNTHQEFEYIQNFKVLQACFTQNGVDKYIPVDRLIKLKFQENLEFLQWVKKFWDAHFPGGHYDAIGRRGGKQLAAEPTRRPASMARAPLGGISAIRSTSGPVRTTTTGPSNTTVSREYEAKLAAMTKELTELRLTIDEVEKERDFYFGKLRDIELETQRITEAGVATMTGAEVAQCIQAILYKTEDGFETPAAQS